MQRRPSLWWPTPARPQRFFSDADLSASLAYNHPLRRAGLLAALSRLVLLVLAARLAGLIDQAMADDPATSETMLDSFSASAIPALTGGVLTALALRLPSNVADAWFEYRHEPRVLGTVPSPVRWFIGVVTATTLLFAAISTVGSWALFQLVGSREQWPLILSSAIVGSVIAVTALERSVRHWVKVRTGRICESGLDPARADFEHLATLFGLDGISFLCERGRASETLDAALPAEHSPVSMLDGATAYTTGIGPNRRVVVSQKLMSEPPATRNFVVAHEIAHVSARHVLVQTLIGTTSAIAFVWICAALAADGRPWAWFGMEPLSPCSLPILALIVTTYSALVAPATSWLARSHERQADLGAFGAVGLQDLDVIRTLYLAPDIDLEPPWWVRLYSNHPTPAERLEFLRRLGVGRSWA